jgi:hypothetical protein
MKRLIKLIELQVDAAGMQLQSEDIPDLLWLAAHMRPKLAQQVIPKPAESKNDHQAADPPTLAPPKPQNEPARSVQSEDVPEPLYAESRQKGKTPLVPVTMFGAAPELLTNWESIEHLEAFVHCAKIAVGRDLMKKKVY